MQEKHLSFDLSQAQRLSDEDILDIFKETQAIRSGHFLCTSGLHTKTYFQCALLMKSPRTTFHIAQEALLRMPKDLRDQVDLVASPAVGGITYGFSVALALGVDFIFSERKDGAMSFRRSFEVPRGAKVLVCEDVVTTGGSVKEVCDLIEAAGAEVLAVTSIVDRKTERRFSADFYPLLTCPVVSLPAETCDLCAQGDKPESLGSRKLAK